ncbi:MAG: VOC family protein [Thermoplasmata archaeon]|nr:VOC family protein [Thermoplasmata archaeon]
MPAPRTRWVYSGLRVQDLSRSIRFYEKLGLRVTSRGSMEHGGLWVELAMPGGRHALELNFYPTTNQFYEPFRAGTEFDHFGVEVDDIVAWVRYLRRRRLPIVADFMGTEQRLVYVRDPDGNWIEFYEPVAKKAPPRRRSALRKRNLRIKNPF